MPPITGVAGIYGAEIVRVAAIACDEVNKAEGILGQPLELIIEDDGSLPESAVAAAEQLANAGCVALIGNLLSNSRISVAYRVSEPRQIPYLNFSFYEGSIASPYFFHFAALPNQQIDRMIPYMRERYGPRMFFAGNNYEWPRGSIAAAKSILAKVNGTVVGEEYFAIGISDADIDRLLDQVACVCPDVFVPYFVGADQMALLTRFSNRGLKEQIAVVMGHFDEMMASKLPPAVREGCYSSNTYFMTVNTPANAALLKRVEAYPNVTGLWPAGNGIVTNFGEGAYICVKAFAAAANAAGSLNRQPLMAALGRVTLAAPQGEVQMRSEHHYAKVNSYLTRCGADGVFRMVQPFGAIEPDLPAKYKHLRAGAQAAGGLDVRLQAHILEGMNEAVMLISMADQRVAYVNAGAERLFGYGAGEMDAQHFSHLINGSKTSTYESCANVIAILKRRGEWRGDVSILTKGGEQTGCLFSASTFTHPLRGETWLCVLTQSSERRRIDKALRWVAVDLASANGQAYYEAAVRQLAELLEAEFAFISVADSPCGSHLRTITLLVDGAIVPNITYPIEHSPCADARRSGFVVVSRDAAERYPAANFINQHDITACAAIALVSHDRKFLGVAGVMSRTAVRNVDLIKSVLQIYSLSIVATMDREAAVAEKTSALISSETNLRAIANNSLVGILIISGGSFLFANLHILELLGYSSHEMRRLPMDAIMHQDSRTQLLQAFGKSGAEGLAPEVFLAHLVAKNGRAIAVEVKAAPIAWNGKAATMAFVIDLSQRQSAEEELQETQRKLVEAQQQYIDLFEFAPDGLVLTDRQGIIKLVNQQAEIIFGWPREEILGQPIETLMPMGARNMHNQYRENFFKVSARRQMAAGLRSLQGRRKDGTEFPAEIDLAPVTSRQGLMVAAVVRDVTQQRALEEQLAHSVKMDAIGKLTGGMAHDFNNYLGIIIANLDLLLQRELNDATTNLIEHAVWGATSAAELTQNLLAFARRQSLSPKQICVNGVLASVSLLLKSTLGEDITLELDLESRPWDVLVDRAQLESCIINLATNARDAMPS
ncbi:MAG: ABC transporter substrate-binding protein, partial [Rhodospirillaceae bacterium]|nr:ABC transporter substrate-binding protein [Rhodospirillaceae bacterium]